MKNDKYPRFGGIRKRPNPKAQPGTGKPCIVCGEYTTGKADIQVSIFRGDDVLVGVCSKHLKPSPAIVQAYIEKGEQS